jgi:hypothetical protein
MADTGLREFGDDTVLDPLRRLVDSLNDEANLSEREQQQVANTLTQNLATRLKIEGYLHRHPELLERPIEKPLFVFGLPRTGTTLVINLLNEDPERRCFLRWEASDPVPPPRPGELHAGPRYEKSQAQSEMALKHAPQIAAIHFEHADSPTECQFLMSPSFISQYYDSMYHIPSYHRWFLHEADYLPAFRFHKRFLQLLQAETGGRWTLKNPWHPLYLDALTTVYPDAQLVMTHRDPVEVLGSACSLLNAVRPMFSDEVDRNEIGQVLVRTFDVMIERTLAYKEKHGWDAICDLQYTEVMQNPIDSLQKVYEHFGETISSRAKTAMQAYIADNPKGKHGRHDYNLQDYGLSADWARRHYRDYCERFSIPLKIPPGMG